MPRHPPIYLSIKNFTKIKDFLLKADSRRHFLQFTYMDLRSKEVNKKLIMKDFLLFPNNFLLFPNTPNLITLKKIKIVKFYIKNAGQLK